MLAYTHLYMHTEVVHLLLDWLRSFLDERTIKAVIGFDKELGHICVVSRDTTPLNSSLTDMAPVAWSVY